jgi:large subunit ribosomal protein L22
MEAVAKLKNCPIAPRKMRMVADLIRGERVDRALGLLKFEPKIGSVYIEKTLLSAISNWQSKNEDENVDGAELYVKTIFVDQGRTLKRLRPAPQGRAHRIRKRSNHITLIVDSLIVEKETAKAQKEPKEVAEVKPGKASAEKKSAKKEKNVKTK